MLSYVNNLIVSGFFLIKQEMCELFNPHRTIHLQMKQCLLEINHSNCNNNKIFQRTMCGLAHLYQLSNNDIYAAYVAIQKFHILAKINQEIELRNLFNASFFHYSNTYILNLEQKMLEHIINCQELVFNFHANIEEFDHEYISVMQKLVLEYNFNLQQVLYDMHKEFIEYANKIPFVYNSEIRKFYSYDYNSYHPAIQIQASNFMNLLHDSFKKAENLHDFIARLNDTHIGLMTKEEDNSHSIINFFRNIFKKAKISNQIFFTSELKILSDIKITNKYAYFKIRNFLQFNCAIIDSLSQIYQKSEYSNTKIIFDLRNNGGGSTDYVFQIIKIILNQDQALYDSFLKKILGPVGLIFASTNFDECSSLIKNFSKESLNRILCYPLSGEDFDYNLILTRSIVVKINKNTNSSSLIFIDFLKAIYKNSPHLLTIIGNQESGCDTNCCNPTRVPYLINNRLYLVVPAIYYPGRQRGNNISYIPEYSIAQAIEMGIIERDFY